MDQRVNSLNSERDERVPSQVSADFWIGAYRRVPGYPQAGAGKWLIHARSAHIDNLWRIVMLATEEGYLGSYSKVSTASLPYTEATGIYVICIYTYDRNDREDILRIREALRELGIEQKIQYAIILDKEQINLYYE
jgi:hypothetical protein